MSASMEERLKRRKLDALKRGVHRATGSENAAVATHIVGIGKAGAGVLAETLRSLQPGAPKLIALAVDIGDQDLSELRTLAAEIPAAQAEVTILALDVPSRETLLETLAHYPEFLTLEYPRYRPNPHYQPWLPQAFDLPAAGGHFERATAKAIAGRAYYDAARTLSEALRTFAAKVDASGAHAMVAVVFGMGGGTGSGIAVDVARHLSNRCFGRRLLVAGIGIAPCDGDRPGHRGASLFPLLNELDTMGDEEKNRGVVMSCGELYRNPFTAGFVMAPQQQAWQATQDLGETQRRCDREIASLLTTNGCRHFWELLRLLNWVAAPSTQHSAARTPWGSRWIHMLGYADAGDGGIRVGTGLPEQLGLLPSYVPEFIELRVANLADAGLATIASNLEQAFTPDVAPSIVDGGPGGSVQFILPCIGKTDLHGFAKWRAAYDAEPADKKLLGHSLLLEHGVLLSAPSTRIAGMAGASLWGGDGWVAVPLEGLLGEKPARMETSHAA